LNTIHGGRVVSSGGPVTLTTIALRPGPSRVHVNSGRWVVADAVQPLRATARRFTGRL
jgi:hypothetical protein